MAEPGDILHSDDEPVQKPVPWGLIVGVCAAIGLVILLIWGMREKRNEQQRQAVIKILDQELTTDQEAIKAQREKLTQLSQRIETLRAQIQIGQVKAGKATTAEFNALVAQQHVERDKFSAMAEAYNKKVAKFKEISE